MPAANSLQGSQAEQIPPLRCAIGGMRWQGRTPFAAAATQTLGTGVTEALSGVCTQATR